MYILYKFSIFQPTGKAEEPRNPFVRTRIPFGGLINDLRRRYPKYLSDIKVLVCFGFMP